MSKKHRKLKKRIKRANQVVQQLHENRHHCLFQRRYWDKDINARYVRAHFIYTISVSVHNEYHHTIGKDIPIPSDIARIAAIVKADQPQFDKVWFACWYLISLSEDEAFKRAMTEQYNFFAERNL